MKECLKKCRLFAGMSEPELQAALHLLNARECRYKKGECLIFPGGEPRSFGLVSAGRVNIYTEDIHGDRVLMASAVTGDTFYESICFLNVCDTPVSAWADEDSSVFWLTPGNGEKISENPDLYMRFTAMLAERTLRLNDRIQILAKPTIKEKLNTFFAQEMRKCGSRTFDVPFDRASLASYLGTNRAALSRELSRLQREGKIEFYKNSFKVL